MEIKIIKMDNMGRGIGYIDGKVTFVPKSIDGDIVDIDIIESKSKYNIGKLKKIIVSSKKRVKEACPYFNECGGCDIENMSYDDTINYKREIVSNMLKQLNISITPEVFRNQSPYHYRNKISLKIVNGIIGYNKEKSHDIIGIKKCMLAMPCLNEALTFVKDFNIINGSIVLRCNKNSEVLITINTFDKINIDIDKIKSKIKLVGIVINNETFYGDNFLYEVIDGIIYKYSYDAFFQVNPNVAELLFKEVNQNVYENDQVLDLYCGVGSLSLGIARKAKSVVGVEIVPNAILSAIFNKKINKCNNIEFVLNDASVLATNVKYSFNKLIVDPPRSGLSKSVLEMIKLKKVDEIIYVSCDIETLKRDLKELLTMYKIKKFCMFDMFSYTYHLECMCILERIN